MAKLESLLTIADVARLTGLSARTVRRLVQRRTIPPPIRVAGRSVRFRASEIDEWLRAGCPDFKEIKKTTIDA